MTKAYAIDAAPKAVTSTGITHPAFRPEYSPMSQDQETTQLEAIEQASKGYSDVAQPEPYGTWFPGHLPTPEKSVPRAQSTETRRARSREKARHKKPVMDQTAYIRTMGLLDKSI